MALPPPSAEAGDPKGDVLATPVGPVDVRSVALTGLFLIALGYAAHAGRAFLVPVAVAFLLEFLFSPLVRRLERARIPAWLSSGVIVLGVTAFLVAGGYALWAPASEWIRQAPQGLAKLEAKARAWRAPVEQVSRTAEQVERLTEVGPSAPLKVEVQEQSLAEVLFGGTSSAIGALLVVLVLLYFLLASGELFLNKLVRILPRLEDKKRVVQIARETEAQISQYLIATTLTNIVFGGAVGLVVWLLGLENPVLWGVIAGLTNFVPYVGGVFCTLLLAGAGLLQFDTVGRALLPVLAFNVLNFIEGNLLTPLFVGRQLTLNPIVVFLGVLFWGGLWGVTGSLLAVPLLAVLKITCDHVEGLRAVGEFLGPASTPPKREANAPLPDIAVEDA